MLFTSRRTAYTIMQEFEDLLFNLVRNRPKKLARKEPVAPQDELLVHMLERAFEEGRIDEQQFRDNLKITFLTAHENTQQLLNSTFWQLGVNQVRTHHSLAICPFLYFHNPRSLRLINLHLCRTSKTTSAPKCSQQESATQTLKPSTPSPI